MGKVRARKETNNLYLDFSYLGHRCREQTALSDTPINRKKVEALLKRIEAQILLGGFDYAAEFPGSKNLARIKLKEDAKFSMGIPFNCLSNETHPFFSEFSDLWFLESEVQWRNSHKRNVRGIIDGSLKPFFGNKPIDQITKAEILQFRAALSQKPGRNCNGVITAKTINSHMGILRVIMTEASDRYNFQNPYRNIKPLKQKKTHIEPFSLVEVNQIINSVRKDYQHYYTVRFFTGMRTGEVDGLKWEYVDFDKRQILVRETLVNGVPEYTKTDGSQREIPMLTPVFDALQVQFENTGNLSEYVFCNSLHQPLDHNNVTKRVWYPLLQHLGMKKRRPYQTRHTAATLFLASGENPEWVAKVLGHSSTEMLFRVYSRYIPNLTRQDGSAFERLLGAA
ncbi:Arm DNA-binding domain-containing protein [Neptuniibacter sp.]|uniref:Arm DNA-binding domain-containing protein n=1 Tax=Neptuniibacter sp. TaxID=1962643 RepID=UPI003B5A7EDB